MPRTLKVVLGLAGLSSPLILVSVVTSGRSASATGETAAVQSAFAKAENLRYASFAPPEARSATYGDAPVDVKYTVVSSDSPPFIAPPGHHGPPAGVAVAPGAARADNPPPETGRRVCGYSPGERAAMLSTTKREMAGVVSAAMAQATYDTTANFTGLDCGSQLTLVGGMGADVLSFGPTTINGSTATVSATVRLWSKLGSLTPQGTSDAPPDGQERQVQPGDVKWTTVDSVVDFTATMTQNSDGTWELSDQTGHFQGESPTNSGP